MSLGEWSRADHQFPDKDILLHDSLGTLGRFNIDAVLFPPLLVQEGEPLPAPESGLCLPLRNESSDETYMLTKQETSLGRGARRRAAGSGDPEPPRHVAPQARLLW